MNKRQYSFSALLLTATLVAGAGFMTISGCASTNTHSSTGEYIDDTLITAKVTTAIMNDPDLGVTEINVETFKGVAQVSGFVSTRAQIDRAVVVVGAIDGVASVKDDLQMK